MRLTLAILILGVGTVIAPDAWADSPVTITPSGPSQIETSSDTSTGRVVATFAIADASMTATGAIICRKWGGKEPYGCQYRRLDGTPAVDEYGDPLDDGDDYTRWDISGSQGNWWVDYPIGFDGISRDQCLGASWSKEPFLAQIEVVNDDAVVLATSEWRYSVVCTGIEGGATGPKRSKVYAARASRTKDFSFFVLDTKHVLNAFRICRYDAITDAYGACDYENLTSRHRATDGWTVVYSLTFKAMGSSLCRWVDRTWPSAGFRVQFFSGDLDRRLTLYSTTRLDC